MLFSEKVITLLKIVMIGWRKVYFIMLWFCWEINPNEFGNGSSCSNLTAQKINFLKKKNKKKLKYDPDTLSKWFISRQTKMSPSPAPLLIQKQCDLTYVNMYICQ